MSAVLRVIYAGTPAFAVPALEALIASEHEVVAVYTQPDRVAGRGKKIQASPIKQLAIHHDIPVEQPASLKDVEAQRTLDAYQADVMVVAAYGLILPPTVLAMPRHGCLNIHGSLLPRWRGAAPIQRAIEAGDSETGVTIMQMAAGLDTGDMLFKTHCAITPDSGAGMIHDCLAQQGAEAILQVLNQVCDGMLQPEVQDETLANYAHKLTKTEARIDWLQSAQTIDRKIRAFDAWPTAFTDYKGQPLRFLASSVVEGNTQAVPGCVIRESREGIDIATGDGIVRIYALQLSGGKRLSVADFINARSLLGECF